MTRPLTAAAIVLLAALGVPTLGDAQTAPNNADAPIAWSSDDVQYEGDTLTLIGRAELIQGQNRLRADRLAGFSQTSDSRMEATGNVYFVTPDQTIRGDRAVYTTGNDTIVVTGDVILTQGQNVATGSRLTYNTRTESARLEGGSNGRVQGVFYPSSTGN
ncbi:LptA/OstA family protein [Brevundimonas sp.]|uniref:LptA/OstA family protein n=1 Tax=Brevundimonas sp. TaxID=1871086 RepID=UPI003567D6E3